MSETLPMRDPVRATDDERDALTSLAKLVASTPVEELAILGEDRTEASIPETAYRLLRELLILLAEGRAVKFDSYGQELSIEQAADILHVPRQYVVQLLERGEIAHTTTEIGQRIRLDNLMLYKRRRDNERRAALQELTRMSQEWGLYDIDYSPILKKLADRE